jgi:hypothetical protein
MSQGPLKPLDEAEALVKKLGDGERLLAELTARIIMTAQEIGLPDAPDKLVEPHALQFLARSHLELLDLVGQLHQLIQEHVDQIARIAIEAALREVARQQGGIATNQIIDEAKTAGMLAAKPFSGAYADLINTYVNTMPNARRRSFPDTSAPDKLRVVPTPAEVAAMSVDDLLAIYCRVMGESAQVFVKYETYIVRGWDGMDGCWTDVTGDVDREKALRTWADRTDGGVHHVAYAEIDYYRIFPGGTRMQWDAAEGREMHR